MPPETVPPTEPGPPTTTAAHTPPPRCERAGCPLLAGPGDGRFCAYHQGWFDAMDHVAKLAEAIYDGT